MLNKIGAFIVLFLISAQVGAQTGSISGHIKIAGTTEIAVGAVVVLLETNSQTIADANGDYQITGIQKGRYIVLISYEGYKDTLHNIKVEPNKNTKTDAVLSLGSRQLNEVNVTGARLDNSSNSRLLLDIKGSLQVLSGISAETINRTTDKDASEIIRRISGVSVNLNKFAVVRGLNESYNTTMLNDLVAPSTEPDKKSFSFDIVPSNLIEKILVYKTASADMPGDFAGGLIKIFTRTPDMGKKLTIELNGYYNEYTTFRQVQYTDISSVDFLGSGAKYRAMPAGVPDYIQSSSSNLTKLFKNNWEVHQQAASPDLRIGAIYSAGGKIGHSFLGSVTAINYYSHSNIYDVHKNEYETPVATLIPDEPTKDYTDHQSIKNVLLSGIQNFNVSFNERNKLEFKNLFSRTGINQTIVRNGTDEDIRIREYSFGYEQRTLYSSQLSYSTRGRIKTTIML